MDPQALPAVRSEAQQNMMVTREHMEALAKHRQLLNEFVSSQLKEGIDHDFAVIPGTGKKSLLKPGAEKLARLFNLGIRVVPVEKEVDRHQNFAIFTHRAEVYSLNAPGVMIASCEASCNSQEKKYRERTKIIKGAQVKEETPICDILNTLQKMSQKRAVVGSVILAVAGSDFFTHDIDDAEDAAQVGANRRPEPTRVRASVPKATSAKSQEVGNDLVCCGRPMMVSKWANKETGAHDWYCTVCKNLAPGTTS